MRAPLMHPNQADGKTELDKNAFSFINERQGAITAAAANPGQGNQKKEVVTADNEACKR